MVALSQGYSVPPCSRAKMMRTDAAREKIAPTKSMRLHALSATKVWKKLLELPYGKPNGIETASRTPATAPPGPLGKQKMALAAVHAGSSIIAFLTLWEREDNILEVEHPSPAALVGNGTSEQRTKNAGDGKGG